MTRLSRAALVGVLVLAAIAMLIVLAWPRAEDVQLRSAYAQLEASRVPVKTLGWIEPRAARAELGSDSYTLQVSDPDLGEVVISGCRQCPDQSVPRDVSWTETDVTYAIRTTADLSHVLSRIVPLAVAREQLAGRWADTPLLYLIYLPAFVAFAGWGVWTLLVRPAVR